MIYLRLRVVLLLKAHWRAHIQLLLQFVLFFLHLGGVVGLLSDRQDLHLA